MAKKKRKKATQTEQPPSQILNGTVLVTFDAGGQASGVNPNPVVPTPIGDDKFRITWKIQERMSTSPLFAVEIGNVVLCDQRNKPRSFKSTRSNDGQSWTWTFRPYFEQPVDYELFFVYSENLPVRLEPPKKGKKRGPLQRLRTLSLRQILDVDPTIFPEPEG